MRRRLLIIVNPTAGVARRVLLERTLAALARLGAVVTEAPAAGGADDAKQIIADAIAADETDAVIAAGGDGTFRQAAIAAAGSDVPVGIIPMGTGNVLANEIGLSRNSETLAKVLLMGRPVEIQGGTVNGTPFFLWVGAGFDGRTVQTLSQSTKRRFGRAAYLWPGLKAFAAGGDPLEIEINGQSMEAGWVVVTNARRYGGVFTLSQKTSVTEPGLVAVVLRSRSRAGLFQALTALAMGRLGDGSAVGADAVQLPCESVLIRAASSVPLQVDGDAAGATPAAIRGNGLKVQLIVP